MSRGSTRDSRTSRDDYTEDQISDDPPAYSSDSRSRDVRTKKPSKSSNTLSKPKSGKSNITSVSTRSLSPASYSKGSSGQKRVKAIYDFEANGDDELTIAIDDLITVTEEIDEGWWIGQIVDPDNTVRSGMFPANYTVEIDERISDDSKGDEPDTFGDEYEEPEEYQSPPKPTHSNSAASSIISRSPQPQTTKTRHVPPVPSRQSKPPPSKSSRSAPTTRSATRTSTASAQRTSYLPDLSNSGGTTDVGPCRECGCDEFSPDVFKKDKCNNCFHKHK
jgi:hypothetical protein